MGSKEDAVRRREFYRELTGQQAADWLRAAQDVAQRAESDAGEQHGPPADFRHRLERQTLALKSWAAENGLVIGQSSLPGFFRGGREHHLADPLAEASRLVKITIGPEFGFYPQCFPNAVYRDVSHWFATTEATPLEYFRRLLLLNELFPRCHTRLLGFVLHGGVLNALTAQLIARGQPASDAHGEIRNWLGALGFRFICAWTWFRPADGIALFDVLEKNVMRCDDGEIVPFDVIPIRCEGQFLEMMNQAAARVGG